MTSGIPISSTAWIQKKEDRLTCPTAWIQKKEDQVTCHAIHNSLMVQAARLSGGAHMRRAMLSTRIGRMVDQASSDSVFSNCCKICRERDPVVKGRFSCSRIVLSLFTVVGMAAGSVALADDDHPGMAAGFLVAMLGFVTALYFGGDLFMLVEIRDLAAELEMRISGLQRSSDAYEAMLADLCHVSDGLDGVCKQLGNDFGKTTKLLSEMERYSALQTIATITNRFFASDLYTDGHIDGDEAIILIPQLINLWHLVPGFDQGKLLAHVQVHGLWLADLSKLVGAIIADTSSACLQVLEELMRTRLAPVETSVECPKAEIQVRTSQRYFFKEIDHECASPNESDVEFPQMPARRLRNDTMHGAPSEIDIDADVEAAVEKERKEEREELEPLFTIPLPQVDCDCFQVGPVPCWGYWHAAFITTTVLSFFFFVLVCPRGKTFFIILSLLGFRLSLGLSSSGKQIEMILSMRRKIKWLEEEHDWFETLNNDLGDQALTLTKIEPGLEAFQQLASGSVQKAHALIQTSDTKIKMLAVAVVAHLFRSSSLTGEATHLEGADVDRFLKNLSTVFCNLRGFKPDIIRKKITHEGLSACQLNEFVEYMLNIGEMQDKETLRITHAKIADMKSRTESKHNPHNPFDDLADCSPCSHKGGGYGKEASRTGDGADATTKDHITCDVDTMSAHQFVMSEEAKRREELAEMKVSSLKAYARARDIPEDMIAQTDDADVPKTAMVDLIIRHIPTWHLALDTKLRSQRISQLKSHARENGVAEETIAETDDSDAPKDALINLILDACAECF